jgi:hypothetical protein
MDIEQRIAHLERSNRHLRIGLVILTIAITFGIVGQGTPGDVIKAKEFQVVNDDGQVLVRLAGLWSERKGGEFGFVRTYREDGKPTGTVPQ